MSGLNGLKYLKFSIKEICIQFIRRYRLRGRNWIGRSVYISDGLQMGFDCNIKNGVLLGENVSLGNRVSIGVASSLSNISVGDDTQIESGVKVTGNGLGRIVIGANCYIGMNNVLDWSDSITIGDFVHIAGPSTGLWTHTSVEMCLKGVPLAESDITNRPTAPIKIGNNVYIGGSCIIYPGVQIEHNSVVAPNSVVTKDVKAYTMVAGSPAKTLKLLDRE